MGKGPKKQDYAPSQEERTSAAIANAQYEKYVKKYEPALITLRDSNIAENPGLLMAGRAAADVAQQLKGMDFQSTQKVSEDNTIDYGGALLGQLSEGRKAGKALENKQGADVLAAASNQALDAQDSLAGASDIATSDALSLAKQKSQKKLDKAAMTFQLAQGAAGGLGGNEKLFGEKGVETSKTAKALRLFATG